jgi:putative restriction endonuclease
LRDVRLGWISNFDNAAAQCLIEFDDTIKPPTSTHPDMLLDFRLEASRSEISQIARRLKRDPKFKFEVGKRCGWQCSFCTMSVKILLDAAHVRGVADRGSDDARNGLILCKNHHIAFDKGLVGIHPETGRVTCKRDATREQLGISIGVVPEVRRPHIDALHWRWAWSGAGSA